jgi:peptidoglycan/LPS O-acetylase OafA/YrhL
MGLIRLLLALSVVAAHSHTIIGLKFVGGPVAVQSFFIISGFYMSLILNEKYVGVNNSYRLFITNRFIRLFPIYWAILIATLLACVGFGLITKGQSFSRLDSYLSVKFNFLSFSYLIASNIFIFGQDVVMFLGIRPENGTLFFTTNFWNTNPRLDSFLMIPQAWSLEIELIFYLIAPYILKRGLKIVISIIVLSFLLRLIIYNYLGLQNDPWTYRFFPTEIIFFLLGYVSFTIYVKLKTMVIPPKISQLILLYVVALTFLYPFLPSLKPDWFPFSVRESVYFASIFLSIPFLFHFLKRSKLDNQIGELSYPVYISHVLVGLVCKSLPFVFLRKGWAIALFTIIVSFLLNKIIAAPIEKYRQSRLK